MLRRAAKKWLLFAFKFWILTWCVLVRSTGWSASNLSNTTTDWVTEPVDAPHVRQVVFESKFAKTKVSYHIYTPEVYTADERRRFPVIYWLHGWRGGLKGIPHLSRLFDEAIRSGKMPPALVVFPNGMTESMWCDSKDGKVPMESVLVEELVPHVDANFRTIRSREGRVIEGFSMGGYGAARLGFKYNRIFSAVSILGAGPLQLVLNESVGPQAPMMVEARERVLKSVYGNDQEYFRAQSPWVLAEEHAGELRTGMAIRILVGTRDGSLELNRELEAHLKRLGVPHTIETLPNVPHDTMAVFRALGDSNWAFYRTVFGGSAPDTAAIPLEDPIPPASGHPIVERLKTFDHNGDGSISWEDVPPPARRIFKRIDRNGDGELSPAELADFH
jgi:enterochelin esterase-like enzyme